VRLPVLRTQSYSPIPVDRASAAPPDQLLPSLAGTTVLVVDDEPDARALLDRLLKECGARVVAAGGALEALQTLERQPVDMILSDVGMPGVDGYEFMRRLRAHPDPLLRKIPAIAVTAYARDDDRQRSAAAGFQQHVAKPYSFPELASAVAVMMRAREHDRS
jgi:CheY-like chemotaxis protein